MSDFNIYRTAKLPDSKIIKLFEEIEGAFGGSGTSYYTGNLNIRADDEDFSTLKKGKSFVITRAQLNTEKSKFIVHFYKGLSTASERPIQNREASAYFDEILVQPKIQTDQRGPAPSLKEIQLLEKIVKKYVTNVLPELTESGARTATDLLNNQISAFGDMQQEFLRSYNERHVELEKKYDDKLERLESIQEAETKRITEKEKELDDAHILKLDALNVKEAELDDREYKHVRRSLLEDINNQVKNRLTGTIVSPSVSIKAYVVLAMYLGGAFLLSFLAYSFTHDATRLASGPNEVLTTPEAFWFVIIKAVFTSIGAVAFALSAINWVKKMYEEDKRVQLDTEKYGYDVNRASWIIETIMEMKEKDAGLPPETWISATCSDLFNTNSSDNEDKNDLLEALLTSSKKVELGTEGTKFEMQTKGAKQLAKSLD